MKKLSFLIIAGIFVFGIIWFYQLYTGSLNYALDPSSEKRVVVDIKNGSSATDVADILAEKGLIKSPYIFKLYLKQNGLSDKIKAGHIVLQENFDMKKIADTLVAGKSAEITATILEGWTAKQMADYLEQEGLTTADKFMECVKTCKFDFNFLPKGYLEGYLYPDTYFANPASYTDQGFISRMIQTLENKLTDSDWKAIKSSKHTFEQIMIMASIVEREERDPNERPTVAGILWNRFDSNVGLGADATILYALDRTKGGLTYNDLQTDSPYNTRKYRGLPPTPISNPSITSIRAAISPNDTDYFYYLHDSEGGIHYAKTLEEHNANKQRYL
jgi:UPF0755 protein